MKRRFKNLPAAYVLTHRPSGMFYVGSSGRVADRISHHFQKLSRGTHKNKRLQSLFTCREDFDIEVTLVADLEAARTLEQKMLDERHGEVLCCNVGDNAKGVWKVLPTDHKTKMTDGRLASPIWREAIANTHKGTVGPMAGKVHSDETKRKISAAKKGKSNGLEGKKLTEEHRANLRVGQGKRKLDPKYKEKALAAAAKRAIPVSIAGTVYPSTRHAAEALGLHQGCVDHRLRSTSPLFKDWIIIRE